MESPDRIGRSSLGGRAPYTTIYLRLAEGVVAEARFETFGCGVSIACCSVVTELAKGKSVDECLKITNRHVVEALGGVPPGKVFCANLVVQALHDALKEQPSADEG